jgi:dTDP-4-dehydrorhamnose reductase
MVTGANGMIGWELTRALERIGDVTALARDELDLADPAAIVAQVRAIKPAVIVNAAAYTEVDKAEQAVEHAMLVNAAGPAFLAAEAHASGALLVHYSTDYVFDGAKQGAYVEDDPPAPLSVYGRSKLAGEQAILGSGCRHLVLRTSWVYADRGRNFLLTMLRLGRERPELRVVDDQHGAPTWARDLAEGTAAMLGHGTPPEGLFHFTAAGATTWCGFATEIFRCAGLSPRVTPITTAEYPTAARRPANSVLSNARLEREARVVRRPWQESLRRCLSAH